MGAFKGVGLNPRSGRAVKVGPLLGDEGATIGSYSMDRVAGE